MLNNSCPVSLKKINETIARLNAVLTVIGLSFFIIGKVQWIAAFLALDFFIRGFLNGRYSIFSNISGITSNLLALPFKGTNAAPKIFAAKIGFFFSVAIGITSVFNFQLSIFFAAVMILFASLEGIFGICVGCKLYSLKKRFGKPWLLKQYYNKSV